MHTRAGRLLDAMPETVGRSRPRVVSLIVGVALIAAACGGSSTTTLELGADAPAPDPEPATGSDPSEAGPAPADEAVAPEEEQAVAADEAEVVNLFPDVDVVNVADSSTLNLAAELGGGDLPVLLWFWAPH